MPDLRILPLVAVAMSVATTGCVSSRLFERLGLAEKEVAEKREALEDSLDRPKKRLTWKRACALMDANNVQLRQARQRQKDYERERKRFVFDQINPRISAIANLSSVLGELSDVDNDDYGIRLFANFRVPNPISTYARRYSLELRYYMGALSLHELERRLKANLYGEFVRHSTTPPQADALNQGNYRGDDLQALMGAIESREQRAYSKKSRDRNLRASLNRLLNTHGENWDPDVSTLPDISYAHRLDRIDPDKGFGRLALKQAAGQFEVALASKWKIKLDELPNFNAGVSLPTVYDSRFDQDGFDAEDTRLFFSLNKGFDLSGREALRAQKAEDRYIMAKESLNARMEREIHRLEGAKQQYRMLLKEEGRLNQQLKWMKRNPPSEGSPAMVIQRVRDLLALKEKLQSNKLKQQQLDLEFWVWDENYWKSPF